MWSVITDCIVQMASKQDVRFCLFKMSMLSMLPMKSAKVESTFFYYSIRYTKPENIVHTVQLATAWDFMLVFLSHQYIGKLAPFTTLTCSLFYYFLSMHLVFSLHWHYSRTNIIFMQYIFAISNKTNTDGRRPKENQHHNIDV